MGLVKCKRTTKATIWFWKIELTDIHIVVRMEGANNQLDQTGMKYVLYQLDKMMGLPTSGKSQHNGMHYQYGGKLLCLHKWSKRARLLLAYLKSSICRMTYSENHWSNEYILMGYLHNILIPYHVLAIELVTLANKLVTLAQKFAIIRLSSRNQLLITKGISFIMKSYAWYILTRVNNSGEESV